MTDVEEESMTDEHEKMEPVDYVEDWKFLAICGYEQYPRGNCLKAQHD